MMKPSTPDAIEPVYPFRWDVTKRSQIGSLIGDLEPDQETWLRKEMYRTEWRVWRTIDDEPPLWLRRERPVAFIDIVSTGGTFGNLVGLLHSWCVQNGSDWPAVQRKIRIIGLPKREKTSPKTWRWWQHAEWVGLLEAGTIKNVSIPAG